MDRRIVHAVLAGLVGSSTVGAFASSNVETEKCFGVAKKGENDCGTDTHACSGEAKKDYDSKEWKNVPKGKCKEMLAAIGNKGKGSAKEASKDAAKATEKPAAPAADKAATPASK
jgi:uncharacterized membrane protein